MVAAAANHAAADAATTTIMIFTQNNIAAAATGTGTATTITTTTTTTAAAVAFQDFDAVFEAAPEPTADDAALDEISMALDDDGAAAPVVGTEVSSVPAPTWQPGSPKARPARLARPARPSHTAHDAHHCVTAPPPPHRTACSRSRVRLAACWTP